MPLIARADWSTHGLTPTTLAGYESSTGWIVWDDNWTDYTKVSDYFHGVYPDTTGTNSNGGAVINLPGIDTHEIFIEFKVRYPRPTPFKQGLKFCKVFGTDGDGVTAFDSANVTYNPDYDSGGVWSRISFGDGTTTANDTSNNIWFGTVDGNPASAGYNASWIGRIFPSEVVARPYANDYVFDDQDWHTVRIHHSFNSGTTSGNEVADAKAIIWVDGVLILNAAGFFNRHPTNPRRIKSIEFGGWTQNTGEFDIDYKEIFISTGGFVGASDTTPDTFTVPAQNNVALNTAITSASVTPTGYDTAAPVTVTGRHSFNKWRRLFGLAWKYFARSVIRGQGSKLFTYGLSGSRCGQHRRGHIKFRSNHLRCAYG